MSKKEKNNSSRDKGRNKKKGGASSDHHSTIKRNRQGSRNPARILWIAGAMVTMCALLVMTVCTSSIMTFHYNPAYPIPDTAFAHFVVFLREQEIWRYLLMASGLIVLIAWIVRTASDSRSTTGYGRNRQRRSTTGSEQDGQRQTFLKQTGSLWYLFGMLCALIIAVMGYFYIIPILIVAFIPLTAQFTQKQLAWALLILEVCVGLVIVTFQGAGLLTGGAGQVVPLQAYQWNYFGLCSFALFVIVWYIFGKRKTILFLILLAAMLCLEIWIFECRTAVAVMVVFVPLIFLRDRLEEQGKKKAGRKTEQSTKTERCRKLERWTWCIFRWLPLIALAVTIITSFVLVRLTQSGNNFDGAFFARFTELYTLVFEHGIRLMGHGLELDSTMYQDNSYVELLCRGGLIPCICFLLFLLLINRRIAERKDYGLMVVSILVYVYSLMENIFCEPVFLLMAGALLTVDLKPGESTQNKLKQENAFAKEVQLPGATVDNVTSKQAVERIQNMLRARSNQYALILDPDKALQADNNRDLAAIYEEAFLVVADGRPLLEMAEKQGTPLREEINSEELLCEVLAMAEKKKLSWYMLDEHRLDEYRTDRTNRKGQKADVLSNDRKTAEIIADVKEKQPDLMIVALGEQSETFVHLYREELGVPVSLCITAKMEEGSDKQKKVKTCPKWIRALGLAWFHRMVKQYGIGRAVKDLMTLHALEKKSLHGRK